MQLKSPGKKVFQLIYDELYGAKGMGKTQIVLAYEMLSEAQRKNLSRATFFQGINDNLKHNIIAETYTAGVYFINPAYIFNGDRLAMVREYVIKQNQIITIEAEASDSEASDSFETKLEAAGQETLEF
jgi:hypothetical protein